MPPLQTGSSTHEHFSRSCDEAIPGKGCMVGNRLDISARQSRVDAKPGTTLCLGDRPGSRRWHCGLETRRLRYRPRTPRDLACVRTIRVDRGQGTAFTEGVREDPSSRGRGHHYVGRQEGRRSPGAPPTAWQRLGGCPACSRWDHSGGQASRGSSAITARCVKRPTHRNLPRRLWKTDVGLVTTGRLHPSTIQKRTPEPRCPGPIAQDPSTMLACYEPNRWS
jgi:hypothetical protein